MEKVTLSKPITVDGKQVSEIELNLDAVTGADIMFCVSEASAAKGLVVNYRVDAEVHLQLAARVTGIAREQLLKIAGRDFNRLMAPVQGFFLGAD